MNTTYRNQETSQICQQTIFHLWSLSIRYRQACAGTQAVRDNSRWATKPSTATRLPETPALWEHFLNKYWPSTDHSRCLLIKSMPCQNCLGRRTSPSFGISAIPLITWPRSLSKLIRNSTKHSWHPNQVEAQRRRISTNTKLPNSKTKLHCHTAARRVPLLLPLWRQAICRVTIWSWAWEKPILSQGRARATKIGLPKCWTEKVKSPFNREQSNHQLIRRVTLIKVASTSILRTSKTGGSSKPSERKSKFDNTVNQSGLKYISKGDLKKHHACRIRLSTMMSEKTVGMTGVNLN